MSGTIYSISFTLFLSFDSANRENGIFVNVRIRDPMSLSGPKTKVVNKVTSFDTDVISLTVLV